VINHAFVSDAKSAALPDPRVRLANPLSEEQGVLRRSLVIPGLLTTLETNRRQGRRDVCVFEMGRVFQPASPLPSEGRRLGLLLAGTLLPPNWSRPARPVDFFDARGVIEGLGSRLGVALEVRRGEGALPSYLHPGRAALVQLAGANIGSLGELHPDVAREWGLSDEIVVAEVDLEPFIGGTARAGRYRALERFPGVARDLSVVIPASVPAAEIEAQARGAAGGLLRDLTIADRYVGSPVAEGRVSLTLALRFASAERTLTGPEVDAAVERIVRTLRSGGAEIRGE
jgi:phenylalanyl-tRNA synthetase beta chain